MPFESYSIVVVVMALTAGRLPFPKIALKSPEISDDTLQQTSRSLPANLFVLVSLRLKFYVITLSSSEDD
ncbi:hypothetical protein OESDEN_17314 [Oesophagostomum dentatum]|uniref:Uncharacterized protein n=1 Tax=Oesophagostomum dentatum TaxID=61180 RepID=A0A0B1SGH2_OESDE|nr:hypothetical protein OESDEN_17314 [Oesophagostomum dentatum]